MSVSRRKFLATALGASGTVLSACSGGRALHDRSRPTFHYPGVRFPLIFAGERIVSSAAVSSLSTFQPLFGASRSVVNPAEPTLKGARTLTFEKPGEYYLTLNDRPLKVLVFPQDETISSAVVRLFHFCVANSLYCGLEDNAWYKYRERFLDEFFASSTPMMLSCGPTHSVFRAMVAERFSLPTRIVNLSSAYYSGGQIARTTHNVPEVYLPDVGKFVLFDINSGYVARWLDAFDLTEAVRAKWRSTQSAADHWTSLGLDFVHDVDTRMPSAFAEALIPKQTADARAAFTPAFVSDTPVDRTQMLRVFLTGPTYWGSNITWVQPTGTEFLPGDVLLAAYETDARLRQEVVEWETSFKLKVDVVDPDDLRRRLALGARPALDRREWEQRFPAA